MGNCGTKPKTSDGDDAPPPAQPPAPAAEGERKEEEIVAAAPEEASRVVVVAQQSEQEATGTTTAETIEPDEPTEKHEVPREEDADRGKEKETPTTEEAGGELPASTPASVA